MQPEMFGLAGNSENSGNKPDSQEVTAFPVKLDYWEPGNKPAVKTLKER
jgi:hypothetical protein